MSNARDKANIPALNFSSTGIDDNATSTAITIDSSQRVGIGTASPISPLMVQSNEYFPLHLKGANVKGILLETTDGETGISVVQLKNSAYTWNVEGGRRANTLTFYAGTVGGERMCIDGGTGNVGIGTSSPSEKLDVVGNINITGDLTVDTNTLFVDSSTNTVRIGNTSSTNSLIANNHELVVGNESSGSSGIAIIAPNNENSYVSFFDPDNSGLFRGSINYNHASDFLRTYVNGSERMRINSSGYVGIGESSPGAKLEVRDDTNANDTLRLSSQLQTTGYYHDFVLGINDFYGVGLRRTLTQSSPSAINPRLDLFVQNTNTYQSSDRGVKMSILGNGRVGIGTTTPTQNLDVNGTVKATAFQGDGSALTGVGGGKILQVIQTAKTDTFTTTSTSYVDVTGLSASITPSSTSSKILILVDFTNSITGQQAFLKLIRNSTDIYIGDSAGSRSRAKQSFNRTDSNVTQSDSINFLDSPSSTSSTTYKLQVRCENTNSTLCVNRSQSDDDNSSRVRGTSSITLMEVAG